MRLGVGVCAALWLGVGGCVQDSSPDRQGGPAAGGKTDVLSDSFDGLDSREFKVMLDAKAWAGDPEDLLEDLEDDLAVAIEDAIGLELEDPFELDDLRTVRYYDVPGTCALRSAGYSFRERIDIDDVRELTLKFRSEDRGLAELYTTDAEDAEHKLEQDFTAERSIFSSSTSIEGDLLIDSVGVLASVFEGFSVPSDQDGLQLVSGLEVHEVKYDGPEVDLGPKDAKIDLTLWYLDEDDDQPWLVELSFKYKKDEELEAEDHAEAFGMFDAVLGLDGWIDANSGTKTASVYAASDFCD